MWQCIGSVIIWPEERPFFFLYFLWSLLYQLLIIYKYIIFSKICKFEIKLSFPVNIFIVCWPVTVWGLSFRKETLWYTSTTKDFLFFIDMLLLTYFDFLFLLTEPVLLESLNKLIPVGNINSYHFFSESFQFCPIVFMILIILPIQVSLILSFWSIYKVRYKKTFQTILILEEP